MPKLKSHKGALKRFKATKGGVKFRRANRNHILTKKNKSRKRNLRVDNLFLASSDAKTVTRTMRGS